MTLAAPLFLLVASDLSVLFLPPDRNSLSHGCLPLKDEEQDNEQSENEDQTDGFHREFYLQEDGETKTPPVGGVPSPSRA